MVGIKYQVSRPCTRVGMRAASSGSGAHRDERNGSLPANGQVIKMGNRQSGKSCTHTEHLSMVCAPVIEKQSHSHIASMILVHPVLTQALHAGRGGLHIGAMCSWASVRRVSM